MKRIKTLSFYALAVCLSACSTDDTATAESDVINVNANAEIEAVSVAFLYENCDYTGWEVPLEVGDYNLNELGAIGAPNDRLSSLRLAAGFGITLYEDINFGGRSITINGDDPCLVGNVAGGLDFNDQMTSARVFSTNDGGNTSVDVTAVSIANSSGAAPRKGDELAITMTVNNTGSAGRVNVSPKISSSRFEDFDSKSLPSVAVNLAAGQTTQVTLTVGPFFRDNNKHYALNRGDYEIVSVSVNNEEDANFEGGAFTIETSNKILVPVMYDPAYLEKLNWTSGIQNYLKSAFTRKAELFDNGNYTVFNGGMDEMLGIEQIFYPIATSNVSQYPIDNGLCEKAAALAGDELGLGKDWSGPRVATQPGNHGFDYLMALTPDSFGGVACGFLNVQVTGVFDFDLSLERSQILVVHESGHIFGSPHCDPLQGYVMCAGEKHPKYIAEGTFVFNIVSRNTMFNRFE